MSVENPNPDAAFLGRATTSAPLSPGRYLVCITLAAMLFAVGTIVDDRLIAVAIGGSGQHLLLLILRTLLLIAFYACGLELLMLLLQRLGVPALTLDGIRTTISSSAQEARDDPSHKPGKLRLFFRVLKLLFRHPQLILSVLIGTTAAATTIVTYQGVDDSETRQQHQLISSHIDDIEKQMAGLQSASSAVASKIDAMAAVVTDIEGHLPAQGVEGRIMGRFDSVDTSIGALKTARTRQSAVIDSMVKRLDGLSAGTKELRSDVSGVAGRVEHVDASTDSLLKGQASLGRGQNSVASDVEKMKATLGNMPIHTWSMSGEDPTIASEIYRLVQHEDTLDKRVFRFAAQGELEKVIEAPMVQVRQAHRQHAQATAQAQNRQDVKAGVAP